MESEITIHGICLEIQEEAKKSLEACKTDPALLQETLELNKLHFEMVTRMFDDLSKFGPQKQTCAFTYAILKNVQDTLMSFNVQTGQGVSTTSSNRSVKWIPLEIAFKKNIQTGMIKNLKHLDIKLFLEDAFNIFQEVINDVIKEHGAIKVYTALVAEYQVQSDIKSATENKYFNTPATSIFPATILKEWYLNHVSEILLKDVDEFEDNGSGWALKSILFLKIHVSKYNPFHAGSSYIDLPDDIFYKKACINVENFDDNECFKWALLAGIIREKAKENSTINTTHLERITKLQSLQKELDINIKNRFSYPMDVSNISRFEEDNPEISVNVFILKNTRMKKNRVQISM